MTEGFRWSPIIANQRKVLSLVLTANIKPEAIGFSGDGVHIQCKSPADQLALLTCDKATAELDLADGTLTAIYVRPGRAMTVTASVEDRGIDNDIED